MNIDVKRIAELAALRFSDSELSEIEHDMLDLADLVSGLPELEGELEPDAAAMLLRRDDEPSDCLSREKALFNAAESDDGCFSVPKTVEC